MRFCGPATTVTVPCTCPPRVSVKTLGQAVSHTGECYTAVITLFPEQVHLLHTAPPVLFVTGPPGTGKTVVLLLMAIEWLRCGHHVYIVSTWWGSRASGIMLYHLLRFIEKRQLLVQKRSTQLHFLQYDVKHEEEAEKGVNELLQATIPGVPYVIADEVNGDFKNFGERLVTHIPDVHVWASSCYHADAPYGWQMEYLTRPLRSPPAVVREVEQSKIIKDKYVLGYSKRRVPDHTDGPPVRRLYHGGQGHSGDWPINCVTCGLEVARVLHSLRVGVTESVVVSGGTTPACLQWRDVLVLYGGNIRHISGLSVMTGLREGSIPVRVMEDEDIDNVATARSDVVWITNVERVLGLERKVIVHLVTEGDVDFYDRLQLMSRCTSQLLIVSPSLHHTVTGAQTLPVEATESGSLSCTTQGTKTSSSPVSSTELKVVNLAEAQALWRQWVEAEFPDLESRAYFLPPVYVNRVPMTRQSVAGQDVLVLESAPGQAGQSNKQAMASSTAAQAVSPQPPQVQDSDVRDDAAVERVLKCLQKISEQNKEVLVVLSQLKFEQCLGEPCYSAVAAQLPVADSLPSSFPKKWKRGDFDVLLIHRHYGFVVCEVKAFGDNIHELNIPQQEIDHNIRKKLKQAVSQLDKSEAMLSHLVSDIAPGLRITKTIAFPNLTARQLQQAISGDIRMSQSLCRCLGTLDPVDIAGLCLCSDQLSDPKTSCDVSSHVLSELGHWWQRRVAGAGPDPHMTFDLYKTLVARFCGPATTVTVPCTCPPRVSVKILGQAVSHTGECYTAVITLFPEQVHLLHTAPPTLFVTGPPGTGKTVVLLLMAIEWLRYGHHVYILSTSDQSHAVCSMLHHVMLKTWKEEQAASASSGQLHLLTFKFSSPSDVEKVLNDLSQAARERPLYVIADEVYKGESFVAFCVDLLTRVPDLHLWAASCFYRDPPAGWLVESLTRPLRSPPVVVREVQKDVNISADFLRTVHPYSERGVPDHTDGPPVIRLYHRGQGHPCDTAENCVTCGREIANVLSRLGVGVAENTTTSTTVTCSSSGTTPPCLQWRDVLVLYCVGVSDGSGIVTGLKEAGIPVRVMKDDNVEDVATARSDVVWVTDGDRVRGLERKVVVCLQPHNPLVTMSRCMSQLVIVFPDR